MVPSPTSYGLPFPKIGGLQLSYPLLSQDQVKLRTSNLAGTFTGPIQVKVHLKFRRKWSVGVSMDCPNFWVPPIISGTGKATDFKFDAYTIHCVSKKPDTCDIFKYLQQMMTNINNFWYRESSINLQSTDVKLPRTGYQLSLFPWKPLICIRQW